MVKREDFPLVCHACGKQWVWKTTLEAYYEGKPACKACKTDADVYPDHSLGNHANIAVSVPFRPQYFHAIGGYASTKAELFNKAARKGIMLGDGQIP